MEYKLRYSAPFIGYMFLTKDLKKNLINGYVTCNAFETTVSTCISQVITSPVAGLCTAFLLDNALL